MTPAERLARLQKTNADLRARLSRTEADLERAVALLREISKLGPGEWAPPIGDPAAAVQYQAIAARMQMQAEDAIRFLAERDGAGK